MKPTKKVTTKSLAEAVDYWVQQYLQAKANNNTKIMEISKKIIAKLGGKIPKL